MVTITRGQITFTMKTNPSVVGRRDGRPRSNSQVVAFVLLLVSFAGFDSKSLASTVVAWGDNHYGERNVPGDLTNAVKICANYLSCMALRSDGTVAAWGAPITGDAA